MNTENLMALLAVAIVSTVAAAYLQFFFKKKTKRKILDYLVAAWAIGVILYGFSQILHVFRSLS